MKIAIIISDDKIFLPDMLRKFLFILDSRIEIKSLILLKNLPYKSNDNIQKKIFSVLNVFGIRFFFYYCFLHIKNILKFNTISSICKKNSIPIHILDNNINSKDSVSFLSDLNCDIFISILGNQIFKKEVLDIPNLFCINLHSSYLPRYRGMMPTFWQLLNKEEYIGISVFKMDEGIDSGPILLQKKFKSNFESLHELLRFTKMQGIVLVNNVLFSILNNNYTLINNEITAGNYYSLPNKDDVKRFKKEGLKLF